MTENTPTPAELRTLALELPDLTQDQIDEAGDSFGSAYDQIAGPGETYTADVMAMKLYELGWLPPRQAHELRSDAAEMARELAALTEIPEEDLLDVTTERDALLAERDALAAVIEQAPHHGFCAARFDSRQPCTCWKSTAPATVLAQRDARVRAGALFEQAKIIGPWAGDAGTRLVFEAEKADMEEVQRLRAADRIEREAQR